MLFIGYVKPSKRKIICERDATVERALDFLKENKDAIIEDSDGNNYTEEELENVKSFGSKSRVELDIATDPRGTVPESSYRELFSTLGDNTKSSPECDS